MTGHALELLLLLVNAVYGTAYVAQCEAVNVVPPGLLGFARLALAALILAPFLGRRSIIGPDVLGRWDARTVTARSILWGAVSMVPVVPLEWAAGARPAWTATGIGATLYLSVVVTALAYLAWNAALARVPAPRAAIFINVQPVVGVALGICLLAERATAYTALGAALVVAGLAVTTTGHGRYTEGRA